MRLPGLNLALAPARLAVRAALAVGLIPFDSPKPPPKLPSARVTIYGMSRKFWEEKDSPCRSRKAS
jgi:hypothetical protein